MLRALEMRQGNAMEAEQALLKAEQILREAREAAERKERQATPSPWGDSVCMGCGGEKRVWADMVRHTCARCGTPLGELPAPTTAT